MSLKVFEHEHLISKNIYNGFTCNTFITYSNAVIIGEDFQRSLNLCSFSPIWIYPRGFWIKRIKLIEDHKFLYILIEIPA